MTRPKTRPIIVFDIGNVLLRWDPFSLTRRIVSDPDRHQAFIATACAADFLRSMDLADDCAAATLARARAYPEFSEELHSFNARWQETILGPIAENVAVLKELRAEGRFVHAISNFAADKFEETRRIHPFLNDFEIAVISGREKAVKPDARLYELLFERSHCAPDDLLFIDDMLPNIETARRLGMSAIHYTPQTNLRASLKSQGFL